MRKIDDKHHTDGTEIIKTSNGQAIPLSEPTILFRGRDWLALPLLMHYRRMCVADGCNDHQLSAIDGMIEKFLKFAVDNPQTMKQPGITRGL